MIKIILAFIYLITPIQFVFSKDELRYDQGKSIAYNEQNFLINIAKDCNDYGLKNTSSNIGPDEILQTFPKTVSFLYFKKHINELCYYSLSHVVKYISSEFKQQTEDLLLGSLNKCFDEKEKKRPKFCAELDSKAILFDLTILLGSFCSVKSLNGFKKVNCRFKEVGERECKIYQDPIRPLDKCPFQFSNIEERENLYKSYFGKTCKKLRWRKPMCLN